MNRFLADVFRHRPTRRGALAFFWIAMGCVLLSAASIITAEVFMPDNPQGERGILSFYRSFTPWALFWLVGGAVAWVYAQTCPRTNEPQ